MQEVAFECDLEGQALGGPGKREKTGGIKYSDETIKAGMGVFATSCVCNDTNSFSTTCIAISIQLGFFVVLYFFYRMLLKTVF